MSGQLRTSVGLDLWNNFIMMTPEELCVYVLSWKQSLTVRIAGVSALYERLSGQTLQLFPCKRGEDGKGTKKTEGEMAERQLRQR